MTDFDKPSVSLDEIAKAFPAPDPSLATTYFADSASLVELGAKIASSKIITDNNRIWADAYTFWKRATPQQKALLVGITDEFIAFGVSVALTLRDLPDGPDPVQATRDAELKNGATKALMIRDQARTLMRRAAGGDKDKRAAVNHAVGTAETPANLAKGIDDLAALLTSWLKAPPEPLAKRLALAGLNAAYAAQLSAAAAELRAKRSAGDAPQHTRTRQVERDRLDGQNIELLGQLVDAFEHAHDQDSAIPRLVPIATRRLLSRRASSANDEADGDGGDAPAAPVPAGPAS